MTDTYSLLLGQGGSAESSLVGASTYLDSYPGLDEPHPRIYVKFRPSGIEYPILGLIDTGAQYCILNRDIAGLIADRLTDRIDRVVMRTAYGPIRGDLYRHRIEFFAEEGANLEIEATLFLTPEWRGPSFLGYSGVLDRLRFAVHPQSNLFYVAPLH